MSYEINISKNGVHYFATDNRSIGHDKTKLAEIFTKLSIAFPKIDGFKMKVSNWDRVGFDLFPTEYTNRHLDTVITPEEYDNLPPKVQLYYYPSKF